MFLSQKSLEVQNLKYIVRFEMYYYCAKKENDNNTPLSRAWKSLVIIEMTISLEVQMPKPKQRVNDVEIHHGKLMVNTMLKGPRICGYLV